MFAVGNMFTAFGTGHMFQLLALVECVSTGDMYSRSRLCLFDIKCIFLCFIFSISYFQVEEDCKALEAGLRKGDQVFRILSTVFHAYITKAVLSREN